MKAQTESKPLPYFFVGSAVTAQRVQNFLQTKYNLLCGALGKPDTQNVWYSRDHIAKLLEEVDHAGGNGLRIVIGAYEDTHERFAGQLCLMMIPTRAVALNGENIHEDIILENEPDFPERRALSRDVTSLPSNGDGGYNRVFNYGSPCPPLCDKPKPPQG